MIAASQEAGLLRQEQLELVSRVLNIGDRPIGDIMTPRVDVDWIDIGDDRDEMLKDIRACRHEQLLVGKGGIDAPLGMILKKDLLDQALDGKTIDPMAALREPLVVHEATPIFKVLEQFKKAPVRLAMIFDEYGALEGIVTQTDLLEAIAGDLPSVGEEPDVVERADGSLLINGMMRRRRSPSTGSVCARGPRRATSILLPASCWASLGTCPRSASSSSMKAGGLRSSIWMDAASTRCWRSRPSQGATTLND